MTTLKEIREQLRKGELNKLLEKKKEEDRIKEERILRAINTKRETRRQWELLQEQLNKHTHV